MPGFVRVLNVADLQPGECRAVEVEGRQVALFNVDGAVHALSNTCPHRGGPLGEGDLDGKLVTCPWHSWEFDVTSGQCVNNPSATVPCYAVKIEGDTVLVEVG